MLEVSIILTVCSCYSVYGPPCYMYTAPVDSSTFELEGKIKQVVMMGFSEVISLSCVIVCEVVPSYSLCIRIQLAHKYV